MKLTRHDLAKKKWLDDNLPFLIASPGDGITGDAPPSAPTLTLGTRTGTTIDLTVGAVATATSYSFYVSVNGGAYSLAATQAGTTYNYTYDPASYHNWKVTANNAGGSSADSNILGTADVIKASTRAFYTFNSDGTDNSGGGRDLTLSGAPTFSAGKVGNAMDLVTASSQYGATASALITSGSYWFSFWAKWTAAVRKGLISQDPTGDGTSPATFCIDTDFATGKRPRFFIANTSSSYTVLVWGSDINDGNWHLINAWYDGANLNLKVDNSATISTAMVGTPRYGATPTQVGRYLTHYLGGSLDNMLIVQGLAVQTGMIALMYNGGNGYALY